MQANPVLYGLIASTLPAMGYDLVEVEVSDRGLVRVFIDKPGREPTAREGGITIDDCTTVSHHLTRLFAVENVNFERLEVSSPGVDRPLRSPSDFERFKGSVAKIRLLASLNNRRNFEGVLDGVEADQVAIVMDATRYLLPIAEIERSRLVPELDFRPQGKTDKRKPQTNPAPKSEPKSPRTPKKKSPSSRIKDH
jgi:ribosome maturation factor RimP